MTDFSSITRQTDVVEWTSVATQIDDDCIIYGLVDPRTLLVRYVGLSARGLARPRQHKHGNRRLTVLVKLWLAELHELGLVPAIVVLAKSTRATLKNDERWWIAYGRGAGWDLCNLTDGGAGNLNAHPSTRAKVSASNIRRATPEFRDYLRYRAVSWLDDPDRAAGRELSKAATRQARLARRKTKRDQARAKIVAERIAAGLPADLRSSPAVRAVLAEKARIRQADPITKILIGARTRSGLATPEARKRLGVAISAAWTPERRAAMSAHATARQSSSEARKAIGDRVRAFYKKKSA